jgi:hypothetical protein
MNNSLPGDIFPVSQSVDAAPPQFRTNTQGNLLIHRDGSAIFDHAEILSRMCLFSMHILNNSIHAIGGLRVEKLRAVPITLYEMDYTTRASLAIAGLTCTVIFRCRGSRTTTRVKLDVPSWHYYQSIAQRLESEACTIKEACQWIDAVKARRDQIMATFRKAIMSGLHTRGLELPARWLYLLENYDLDYDSSFTKTRPAPKHKTSA